MEKYQRILEPNGFIHLKTDSEFLHGYLLGLLHEGHHEIIFAHHDIYNSSSPPSEATAIQTFYEKQYLELNKAITYVKFRTNYWKISLRNIEVAKSACYICSLLESMCFLIVPYLR